MLQKKSLENNDCLYVASVSERGKPQWTMPIVLKITFKQILELLL